MFKVGDKVIIVNSNSGFYLQEGIIVKERPNMWNQPTFKVEFPDNTGCTKIASELVHIDTDFCSPVFELYQISYIKPSNLMKWLKKVSK